MGKPSALRLSLIWHDEVMSDVVCERPQAITIGPTSGATFVTPDLGLPAEFAIVRPGQRGSLLTLGPRMAGTICVGGVEHDVGALVRGADDGFAATAIGGADWGVIDLDPSGHHKVFFQFVPVDDHAPAITTPMLIAGAIGYAASAIVLGGLGMSRGVAPGEAMVRGLGLATLVLALTAVIRWVSKQDNESRASLAFSTLLHAALVFATYEIYDDAQPVTLPGFEPTVATYVPARLVEHPIADVKPAPKPTVTQQTVGAAIPTTTTTMIAPPPVHPPPPRTRPQIARPATGTQDGLDSASRDVLDGLIHRDRKFDPFTAMPGTAPATDGGKGGTAIPGGPGKPLKTTTGGGPGGPGGPAGTYTPGKPGEIGGPGVLREPMCIGSNCGGGGMVVTVIADPKVPHDDGPSLTEGDIDRVVRSAKAALRACYQKELNHHAQLAGSVAIAFSIASTGKVTTTRVSRDNLHDDAVAECLQRVIAIMHFPAKGDGANVNYPFVFAPGS